MSGEIRLTVNGGVARLIVSRPERRNALTMAMLDQLMAQCRTIERDRSVRTAILTGEGAAFSAGGDIDAWSGLSPEDFARHWIRDGHAAFDALARLTQPVIAVLNGHALGGGLELAACADYRVAERHVKIGLPEPGLGVIPGWSGIQRTARRFGPQVVRRMALFGEIFDAEAARALGVVDQVAPKGEGLAAAEALAEKVAGRAPTATEVVKMMLNAAEGEERERVIDALASRIAADSADLREGLAAFREKRPPKFM